MAAKTTYSPTRNNGKVASKWSDDEDDEDLLVSTSVKKAMDELDQYLQWNKSRFLPKMKALKTLGTYDEDGHVLEEPVYSFGPVIERGLNLPSGKNHADYIDSKGYYDIIKYNLDHEEYFPAMGVTVVGKLGPHLTTEVDCESLFSQAGHQSHPERGRTIAETFERLVIGKHRLSRIFCCQSKVLNEFLERWHKKSWSEEEDRDDVEFWNQQKEEYLEQNPSHTGMFDDLDEGEQEVVEIDD